VKKKGGTHLLPPPPCCITTTQSGAFSLPLFIPGQTPGETTINSTLLPLPSNLPCPFTQFFWWWRAWADLQADKPHKDAAKGYTGSLILM